MEVKINNFSEGTFVLSRKANTSKRNSLRFRKFNNEKWHPPCYLLDTPVGNMSSAVSDILLAYKFCLRSGADLESVPLPS